MDRPVVYDKAKWHYQGDYPKDLDVDQAFVHTGLYFGWIIETGLYSEEFADDFKEEIAKFKARQITGPDVYQSADGVFMDEFLNPEGNKFTNEYFDFAKGEYLADYDKLFPGLPSTYHVADTWENYDRLKPQLDKRFAEWRKQQSCE